MKRIFLIAAAMTLIASVAIAALPQSRYFLHGDGVLSLATNKGPQKFHGRFRNPDGTFDQAALAQINRVFSARAGDPLGEVSPRLIEFIDFIQDQFSPRALVTITSGFRSPERNAALRDNGALAAKASLHQYGMAADLWIKGVPSERIWDFVREQAAGGTGFYHGKNVHLDVGPARFWDETSSKVDTDISDDNKLIGLITDRDIYLPGEQMMLRFIRMTAYPIGVDPRFTLERKTEDGTWKKAQDAGPSFPVRSEAKCLAMSSMEEMSGIGWRVPEGLSPGRYRIRADFCEKRFDKMPDQVATPEFEVSAI